MYLLLLHFCTTIRRLRKPKIHLGLLGPGGCHEAGSISGNCRGCSCGGSTCHRGRCASLQKSGAGSGGDLQLERTLHWRPCWRRAWLDANYLSNHVDGVGPCVGGGFVTPCDPVNHKAANFIGGGQLGLRWQQGQWVLRLEGSLAATRLQDTTASVIPPGDLTYTSELRSIIYCNGSGGLRMGPGTLVREGRLRRWTTSLR